MFQSGSTNYEYYLQNKRRFMPGRLRCDEEGMLANATFHRFGTLAGNFHLQRRGNEGLL